MKAIYQLLGAALLFGLCMGVVLGADDSKKPLVRKIESKEAPKAVTPEELHVKSFALRHCEPAELRQALGQLLQLTATPGAGIAPTAMRTGTPYMGGLQGARPGLSYVVDDRTRTLFVRGTQNEIDKVTGLVDVLDSEPGKTPPAQGGLHVIKLQHAKVDEVMQILNGLQLSNQVVALPKSNLLIVPDSLPSVKEIDRVIETLDVPSAAAKEKPPAPKGETKKKP
jgi:hypothetical protein